ncbi:MULTISPECIES: fluoride efflux transporter CrcB [Bacillaceae]|uniref:fluoride efflux transporter CrcB n=2 Tax=Bacillaceae TaxID=186817 RepID=UPI001047355A|nr:MULTISPECIES: fluoride efflux transporter CrcB [Bacillaceae]MDT2046289.1 fluoride efflux transporter CrcB [Priestia flexa]TDB50026.1 fluoride efflux transporter CrcB [Bacillus sp. CBEL-1]USY53688.1 fluoride efflux transporter CrcB [Bacillus sp. 1780r2a1]
MFIIKEEVKKMNYLLVGIGGIFGSLLRYYLGVFTHSWWAYTFPLGTLITNLIGCFILGWFTYRMIKMNAFPPAVLAGIGTGIVGSFTTFSTFSVETVTLIQNDTLLLAFLYVGLSLFGGLLMSWFGYQVGNRSANKLKKKGEQLL